MNNKIIIFATCFFLLVSFVFLSITERKQSDINTKETWSLYFENPKDKNLDFIIENHSSQENFHWEIFSDKEKIKTGDEKIETGKTKKIPLSMIQSAGKKIIISVTSGNERKKEIYKIITRD